MLSREYPFKFPNSSTKMIRVSSQKMDGMVRFNFYQDEDIFFYYRLDLTSDEFKGIKEDQSLSVDYEEFQSTLMGLFDSTVIDSKNFTMESIVAADEMEIVFKQQLSFKLVEILRITAKKVSEEEAKKTAQERYNKILCEIADCDSEMQRMQMGSSKRTIKRRV